MSSAQNTKARHYAALAARLKELNTNLDETERLMDDMAGHLLAMRSLAAATAAQFMAGSRLVDHELTKQQEEMEALEHEEAEREQGHNTTTGTATP